MSASNDLVLLKEENERMFDINTVASTLLLLYITTQSTAFTSIFSLFQSNQEYTEIVQPWYRVRHAKHEKIPEYMADALFGKHFIPEDGSRGKALNDMKHDGTYNRLSRVHKLFGVHHGPAFMLWHRELLKRFELTLRKYLPSSHNLGIPYWDSSLDSMLPDPKDSIMFTPTFLGTTNDEGRAITGPYANWTTVEGRPYIVRKIGENPEGECFSPAEIDWVVERDDVNDVLAVTYPLSSCETHSIDERFLEYSHNYVHFFISGDMQNSWSSANDIIFLLHHSMVDYIFEMFRQHSQTREQRERDYPESDPKCFPAVHNGENIMPFLGITNKDGLSNGYTDNMYEFAPRPTCEEKKRDCGSKYLYCDVIYSIKPTCMSKIRLGGNCKGFEGTDICYQAECIKGRCEPPVPVMRDFELKKKLSHNMK